jgi:hypothetical protein
MLLKLSDRQFQILERKLSRRGLLSPDVHTSQRQAYSLFYETLSDMKIGDVRSPGYRAPKPNYTELGMSRVAGTPTASEIEQYARVTNGGVIDSSGFICEALMFDTDLMPDRYGAATMNCLVDLYSKYLGRANDFNHSFDASESVCRVIGLSIGTDPKVDMHPHHPAKAMQSLSPMNPYASQYMALVATLAFPGDTADAQYAITRAKNSLTKDISIATMIPGEKSYCSICLKNMERFWRWSYCEEHGFPGGTTEDGECLVEIWDGASDAFVFGFVSDGAVRRAGIVLDPHIKS